MPRIGQLGVVVEHTIVGDPDHIANALVRAHADNRLASLVRPPAPLPDGRTSITVGLIVGQPIYRPVIWYRHESITAVVCFMAVLTLLAMLAVALAGMR